MARESGRLGLTALRIYRYMLLKRDWVGVREIQRALRLSSPGLVAYHLNRLLAEGLVEKRRDGKYRVREFVKVTMLRDFVKLGRLAVPRYAFYATFTAIVTACYVLLYPVCALSPSGALGTILVMFSTASYIYEAMRVLSEW